MNVEATAPDTNLSISKLPQGNPRSSIILWALVLLAMAAATVTYLFLSGPNGFLPRPQVIADLPFVQHFNPSGAILAGGVSAVVFVLVSLIAWWRHHNLMRAYFLLRAFEADPNDGP
jgi:hypothetical protein